MEEEKNYGCCKSGMGGKCSTMCGTVDGYIHCHKARVWKKLFMLIGLLFMFWLGVKIGELRTLEHMQDSRGYFHMMQYNGDDMWAQPQMQMVQPSATGVAPATK